MNSMDDDIQLVSTFLGDALSGKFVVSLSSMKTLGAFKRLKADESAHVIAGIMAWVQKDAAALDKIAKAVQHAYEKCPDQVRAEAAGIFSALAEKLMANG